MKALLLVMAAALLWATACGGGGGSPAATQAEKTPFEKLIGDWTERLYAPYTNCATLDLGDYADEGVTLHARWHDATAGALPYINIEDLDAPGDPHASYRVTSNSDPFTMERVFGYAISGCNWSFTRTYELTFVSATHVIGTQRSDITSTSSYCEECYYTLQWEMKSGIYPSVAAAP